MASRPAPPVSVLLPVRDGAEHLPEAIDSLRAQTFADFDVVVVDDGSTDTTPEILQNWAAVDRRVQIITQARLGIVPALERARAAAAGRYLARMDADDIALPRRFSEQIALMDDDPRVSLCGCRVRYIPRERIRDGSLRYERWLNRSSTHDEIARDAFVECPIAHPTFFMRADAVEHAGGYRDEGVPEDYDLLFRIWLGGGRLAKVPEALLHWRERGDRLSRTHPRYLPSAFRNCKLRYLAAALPKARSGVVIWGSGPIGKAFARRLPGAGLVLRAFVDVDPRKIGQEIHGAPVLDMAAGLAVGNAVHLAAVGQEGARAEAVNALRASGRVELEDFVAIA